MYTAIQIADYIVARCINNGTPISNLQLNKILFFIQKCFLNINKDGLFVDDFEAWQFGPVVPSVYYRYCGFGGASILLRPREVVELKPLESYYIDPIIDEKSKKNPWELVQETHQKNGAWACIYKDGSGNHIIIPKELIKLLG